MLPGAVHYFSTSQVETAQHASRVNNIYNNEYNIFFQYGLGVTIAIRPLKFRITMTGTSRVPCSSPNGSGVAHQMKITY